MPLVPATPSVPRKVTPVPSAHSPGEGKGRSRGAFAGVAQRKARALSRAVDGPSLQGRRPWHAGPALLWDPCSYKQGQFCGRPVPRCLAPHSFPVPQAREALSVCLPPARQPSQSPAGSAWGWRCLLKLLGEGAGLAAVLGVALAVAGSCPLLSCALPPGHPQRLADHQQHQSYERRLQGILVRAHGRVTVLVQG